MLIIREQKIINDNIVIDVSQDEQTNLCSFCSYRTLLKLGLHEYSIKVLSQELYILSYFFDIQIIDLESKETIISRKIKLSNNLKTPLFNYQIECVYYGMKTNHTKWLLLDDMGLGKTLSTIALAEELKIQRGLEHCLIICGIASLRANWEKEIKSHSNSSFITIGKSINSKGNINWATIKERAVQLKNKIDEFFVIINVESLRDDNIIDSILNSDNVFDMIVVDELHKCSNKTSIQGDNLLKLTQSKYRLGLSGTIIVNNCLNCYLPLKWIGVEHSTLTNFKSQYCEFGGFGGHQVVGYKNLDILKDELEAYSLRRTKDSMELPPKTIINEYVEMNDTHRKFYDDIKRGVKEEADKIELKTNNLLALTTRLRQASTCPSILTTNNICASKIDRCVEIVEDLIDQNNKVVVMSTFKEPVYVLEKLLSKYKPLVCTGDISDQIVSDNIDTFQQDDEHKLILCTNARCGTGITLNRAQYMICIDEPFTAALYNQMVDRIYRITNTKPVFIYNLICENTIDERIADIIDRKKALSDYMIDDKEDVETINMLKKYILDL